jgi:hypothetical protein
MSYKADLAKVDKLMGQVAGNGQCVAFVVAVTTAPPTSLWKQGAKVKDCPILEKGTAIATFGPDGKYTNKMDGTAHGAIYISQNSVGIDVWDQWLTQPVHKRTLMFRGGVGTAVNDGDQFYVVE